MKENLYNIAVVINDKYVEKLKVMLSTLFDKNPDRNFLVYILYSRFSDDSLFKIKKFFEKRKMQYHLVPIDIQLFDAAPILDEDMSKEAYFKLLIPVLLPLDMERLLYLDADIIINGDIGPLYHIDLKGKSFAAAADLNMDKDLEYKGRLMPLSYTYFNSGVLLFDLKSFRQIYNFNDVLKYIQENGHKFRFHDQEVFNALFYDKVCILNDKYNYVTLYKDRWDPLLFKLRENLKDIIVIHYAAGNNKPWKPEYSGKYLSVYWKAALKAGLDKEYKRFRTKRKKYFGKILKTKFCIVFPDLKSNIKKSVKWPYYWLKYYLHPKKYSKQEFLNAESVNQYLKELILKGNPFMVCRVGANESFTLRTYEFHHKKNEDKALEQLCSCAGFFPEKKQFAYLFLKVMKEAFAQMDMCGILKCPFDDYFLNEYADIHCKTMLLYAIDPIVYEEPWTAVLKGKKVLVIHPFAESIEKQYKKRKQLFPDKEVLPDFKLLTIKAVQTSAGMQDERFSSWFEALEYLQDEITKADFDIALLGCGAYGLPLAAYIKKLGRQAVHIGGGLQILFGIKGKRWDENPKINCYYNDAWVYPSKEETPEHAEIVEGACYWG